MPRKKGSLNKRDRDTTYSMLVERDGERCRICGRLGDKHTLVVDCVDNTGNHSHLSNLQLLCYRDNSLKNPRGKGRFNPLRHQTVDSYEPKKISSAEMERNMQAEPSFRHWIWNEITKRKKVTLVDAINSGAEFSHCSQQTIRRYIDKLVSSTGLLELYEEESVQMVRKKEKPPTIAQTARKLDGKVMAAMLLSSDRTKL